MRLVLILLVGAALPLPALAAEAPFGPDRVWTVHLRVTPKQWATMEPRRRSILSALLGGPSTQPSTQPASRPAKPAYVEGQRLESNEFGLQYAYVKAAMDIDGKAIRNVGLRFKGNSSYTMTAYRSRRKPFKIDFNRFVDGQSYEGLTGLSLHSHVMDPSQLREALAYALYREAGVPAPRTAFALVYLTIDGECEREYLGMYTVIEDINKTFLRDRFGDSKGLLLKPERARDLPHLGEEWDPYERIYPPKTDGSEKLRQHLIEFTRLLGKAKDEEFERRIDSFIDVDEFLRFLAATALISNLDSFMVTGHNFFLYLPEKDPRIVFMPWDLNLAFGSFNWVGTSEQQADLSIDRPFSGSHWLVQRLLDIERYRKVYHGHVRRLAEAQFGPEGLPRQLARMREAMEKADRAAEAAGKAGNPSTRPFVGPMDPPDLEWFMSKRLESIRAQLDKGHTGYAPRFQRPVRPLRQEK